MKKLDVVRAWRDEEYRNGLSAEEQAALPAHPAGVVELADVSLRSIAGGCSSNPNATNAGYVSQFEMQPMFCALQ